MSTFVIQAGQCDLSKIVLTLRSSSSFTRRLNGRQQERDKDPNDRDYNQEFDKRKCKRASTRIT